jgi:polar amino acid transport system substrate-binding protein
MAGAVRRVAAALSPGQNIEIGFIGAGAFARGTLLPILRGMKGIHLRRVATAHGLTALDAQKRFGFEMIGTDVEEVLQDPAVHLVFIVTRHDQHAELVVRALRAGKHVFVEKPLALNEAELVEIEKAAADAPGVLMVGFNRRYSPHARAIRQAFQGRGPLMMNYRVNAGPLPPGHWLNDPEVGGGRMVGEACHFIDLMSYLTGDADIVSILPAGIGRLGQAREDMCILLSFADGSLGQLLYTTRGSPLQPKELLEVHGATISAALDDYRGCTIKEGRRVRMVKNSGKGHAEELEALLCAARTAGPAPQALQTIFSVSRTTLQLLQISSD